MRTQSVRITLLLEIVKRYFSFKYMFPVITRYIDGQYIKSGQPVRIADPKLIQELEKNARKIINLLHRGVRFTPTQPDIIKIEKIMLEELQRMVFPYPLLQVYS